MFTQQECILMKLLNCGSADLSILEDINYDLDDIVDELQEEGILSLSSILEMVFEKGKQELEDIISDFKTDLINELEGIEEETNEYMDKEVEVNEVSSLSPADDITYFINYLDTHVYIDSDKEEIYRAYFKDEIDLIEKNMGFCFASGCA